MTGTHPGTRHGIPTEVEAAPGVDEIARRRAWQTLLQGLGVDVGIAVALVGVDLLAGWESWEQLAQWQTGALLVVKSAAVAGLSWFIRRYRDRSGVEPIAA